MVYFWRNPRQGLASNLNLAEGRMLVTYFTKDVFPRPITIIQIVEYCTYGPRGLRDVLRKFGLVKIFVRTGFNYFRRGPLDLCLDGRVYKHVIRDSKLDCSGIFDQITTCYLLPGQSKLTYL